MVPFLPIGHNPVSIKVCASSPFIKHQFRMHQGPQLKCQNCCLGLAHKHHVAMAAILLWGSVQGITHPFLYICDSIVLIHSTFLSLLWLPFFLMSPKRSHMAQYEYFMSQIFSQCSHSPLRASSLTWFSFHIDMSHPSSSSHPKIAVTLNNLYQTCWTHLASSNSSFIDFCFSKKKIVANLPFSWFKILVSTFTDFHISSQERTRSSPVLPLVCLISVSSIFGLTYTTT